ncbi:MAG: J domain-containing protein [Lachnospiraceae bacterium]|nr:J domain-containing protein [Lachnospiraceae bacterium]
MVFFGIREAYSTLGLKEGADIKDVKKAYASLIKQYHPEEHPEEWKKIHDAYTFLCNYLNNRQKPAGNPTVIAFEEIKPVIRHEEKKEEFDFDSILQDTDEEINGLKDIDERLSAEKEENEENLLLNTLIDEARRETGAVAYDPSADSDKDREYFSEVMDLLDNLQMPEIKIYGKPVIKIDRFMQLHNHEKFEQAMLYPVFIRRLTDVLSKSSPDPDIRSYLEGDVIKAGRTYPNRDRISDYNRLLKAAESLNSKDVFMANLNMEESKLNGSWDKASKKNERESAIRTAMMILVFIFAGLGFIARIFPKQNTSTPSPSPLPMPTASFEVSQPVQMVLDAQSEDRDYESVLEDYETLLKDSKEFFDTYDAEDYEDVEILAQYRELLSKRMELSLYVIYHAPDLSTEEGSKTDYKIKQYQQELDEIWEYWEPEK